MKRATLAVILWLMLALAPQSKPAHAQIVPGLKDPITITLGDNGLSDAVQTKTDGSTVTICSQCDLDDVTHAVRKTLKAAGAQR